MSDRGPGPGPLPAVSVVMASRGRRSMLRPFVEALVGDPALTEVVIVLDGDVDGSPDALEELGREFPVVRPVLADQRGQSGALELGVERSRSDVVLLMDDDVIAGPGLVSGHARHHAEGDGLVVLGYMPVSLYGGASPATRLYAAEYEAHCARLESGEVPVLEGLWMGNVSARRDDLLRVGIESERYPVRWHADTDLGLRLQAAGLHGVFDRRLRASHLQDRSAAAFLRDARERGHGARLLEREHPDGFDVTRTVPMLDDLSTPARQVVSVLGRGARAERGARILMAVGGALERLGWAGGSTGAAKAARRIEIVAGYRETGVEARRQAGPRPVTSGTDAGG